MITGGEPIESNLHQADERGLGGRNQQLVLAALNFFCNTAIPGAKIRSSRWSSSPAGRTAKTEPTDAAGAIVDAATFTAMQSPRQLDPATFLRRNDAYHFFEPLGGLIKTGPTHTNVCDVRVVVVGR